MTDDRTRKTVILHENMRNHISTRRPAPDSGDYFDTSSCTCPPPPHAHAEFSEIAFSVDVTRSVFNTRNRENCHAKSRQKDITITVRVIRPTKYNVV